MKNNSKYIVTYLISISILLSSDIGKCNICYGDIYEDYFKDAWGNIYHKEHQKSAKFCDSCYRVVSVAITNGGYYLPDNRLICNLCYQSSINTINYAQVNLVTMIDYLSKNGINIDINLVKLNLIYKHEVNLVDKNHIDYKGFTYINQDEKNNVFNIFILKGLPIQEFNATVAHELMHIWISKNNIVLDIELEEYYCNLISKDIYSYYDDDFSRIKMKSIDLHLSKNKFYNQFNKQKYLINDIVEHINER